jgi:D-beta-D-heptose 7-phosphate kinase/D-beta-D-heptose 1-phosphate adenosyltransferase
VRKLKGEGRPVTAEADRVFTVAGLASVDAVVLFDEDTPLNLIKALRPDVLVKGADYERDDVVGVDEVESWGGRIVLVPLVEGRSTSNLIMKVGG